MALNIKNEEVERLANEVARLTGESKTEAVGKALLERRERLIRESGGKRNIDRLIRRLETEVWPNLSDDVRGKGISQEEQDRILGYGTEGY